MNRRDYLIYEINVDGMFYIGCWAVDEYGPAKSLNRRLRQAIQKAKNFRAGRADHRKLFEAIRNCFDESTITIRQLELLPNVTKELALHLESEYIKSVPDYLSLNTYKM